MNRTYNISGAEINISATKINLNPTKIILVPLIFRAIDPSGTPYTSVFAMRSVFAVRSVFASPVTADTEN